MKKLEIIDVHAQTIEGKKILRGVSLTANSSEIHAIMGPNGGGKSTLAQVLMGHPSFELTQGTVKLDGTDITKLPPNERSQLGLFLGLQYPVEVAGVNYAKFLRQSVNTNRASRHTCSSGSESRAVTSDSTSNVSPGPSSTTTHVSERSDTPARTLSGHCPKCGETLPEGEKKLSPLKFKKLLKQQAEILGFSDELAERALNQGFSGGEKKKAEVLQMAMLKPKYAILDEPDSGLDVDALRYIAKSINAVEHPMGLILITHYQRILSHVKPDFVHIIKDGKIIKSGDATLAHEIEQSGYEALEG